MMAQEIQKEVVMPIAPHNSGQKSQLREWLVLEMQTDEMLPSIFPTDELIINTREDFKNGDTVLCFHKKSNTVIVRRFYAIKNCVVFISANYKYEPIICSTKKELYDYEYIGKVVSTRRDYRKKN